MAMKVNAVFAFFITVHVFEVKNDRIITYF
jgi:hypothetical protein